MISKITRMFLWLLGGVAGLIVLLYLVLLAINWSDSPPSAAAKRLTAIHAAHPQVADAQNGFIYMIGMSVTADQSPSLAGTAMMKRNRELIAAGEEVWVFTHPDYPQLDFDKKHSQETKALINACRTVEEKCLNLLASPGMDVLQFSDIDRLLLERYRTLMENSGWQEIYPEGFDGVIPSYAPAMNGQILSLYDLWLNAETRGASTTMEMFERDARFWRSVLNSSDSMISGMVAANGLKRNLLWGNLVTQKLASKHLKFEVPIAWTMPITDEERLLERSWAGEWAIHAEMLKRANFIDLMVIEFGGEKDTSFTMRLVGWLISPLLQRQDTVNDGADEFAWLIEQHRVPYEQLPAVAERLDGEVEEHLHRKMALPHILYNPIGKILNSVAMPSFSVYMLRVSDLEGGRRALLATLELRRNQTPRHKVTEALEASSYRNPYSNEPFKWDEKRGSVTFEGLGEGNVRRYGFTY